MLRGKKAVLIAFTVQSQKFENNSERNKFFRLLYGWKQVIPKENKEYVYQRDGLLDEIPHMRVDQSSFIVPEDDFEKIDEFFDEWTDKVIWKKFKVLLEKSFEDMLDEEDSEEE
jgi:hypothetical protein